MFITTHPQTISQNREQAKHWKSQLSSLRKLHKREAEEWGLEEVEQGDSDGENDSGEENYSENDGSVNGGDKGGRKRGNKDGAEIGDESDDCDDYDEEAKREGGGKRKAARGLGILPDLQANQLEDFDR